MNPEVRFSFSLLIYRIIENATHALQSKNSQLTVWSSVSTSVSLNCSVKDRRYELKPESNCISPSTCSFIFRSSLYTSSGCQLCSDLAEPCYEIICRFGSGVNINELTDGPQGQGEKYECLNSSTATGCSSSPEVKDYIRFPSRGMHCGTTEAGACPRMSYSPGAGGLP